MKGPSLRKLFFFQNIAIIALIAVSPVQGENRPLAFDSPLNLGFNILYGGYKIGEIDITQSQPFHYEKQEARELECRVESSVIIDHHGLYRSIVTNSWLMLYMKADNTTAGKRRIDEYWFDHENHKIRIKTEMPGSGKSSDTSKDFSDEDMTYFDSISMIFRLRDALDTLKTPVYVPVFAYSRPDSILIKSITDTAITDSDGKSRPAKHVSGYIPFNTFPGVGNEFDIYISNDDEKIPLKATLQMALGRVEIILRQQ